MPKAKPATESTPAPAEKPSVKATTAAVYAASGAHFRTYSLEQHGEDFADLAAEFSAHNPGSSVHLV